MLHIVKAVAVGSVLILSCTVAQPNPVFSDTGYAADAYGASDHYPLPVPGHARTQRQFVGYYSHFDQVRMADPISRAGAPSILKSSEHELALNYPYGGQYRNLDDYLERNPVTGLLIARGDTILYEHYRYARTDSDRFMSQSMAKTIVGLLIGIAVSEGAIHSIDDRAAVYVPELKDSPYGQTSIRDLLHMSSGVHFFEDDNAGDDRDKFGLALFDPHGLGAIDAVRHFNTRERAPGTHFSYASIETEVLGLVLSHATRMSVAQYASERIWQKMGMESDASWGRDATGQNITYCCVSATLRDWARLGMMLAYDGRWNGRQIVPRDWVLQATTVAPRDGFLAPGKAHPIFGYGYQVWLLPGERRMFALQGMDGQRIIVDPSSKLVLVQTAVWTNDHDPGMREIYALWYALVAQDGDAGIARN
ncbi:MULTISPECIES: serine hydrolase [Burkholderia]|uniref:serine hydrolase domain-containing protein n=1 Tax=Burkholderia TaxID=32008 RepID=UPI00145489F2|nr:MULTISPECIES: serine hydrolase [Burkholderia]MBN3768919.1 serine hydrolase [Burkholderia sp. Se-20378]VWB22541.1 beta-lactamase class C protein [Burkholderia lata]